MSASSGSIGTRSSARACRTTAVQHLGTVGGVDVDIRAHMQADLMDDAADLRSQAEMLAAYL